MPTKTKNKSILNSYLEEFLISHEYIDSIPEGLKSVTLKSEKTLDIRCPHCLKVSRRSIKAISQNFRDGEDICKMCSPSPRTKTGELFLANNPEYENLFDDNQNDFFIQSKRNFLFGCGHREDVIGSVFLKNPAKCISCRKEERKAHPENSRKLVESMCSKCGNLFSSQRKTVEKRKKESGFVLCSDCFRLSHRQTFSYRVNNWNHVSWESQEYPPDTVTLGSGKRISLSCKEGHSWENFAYAIKKDDFCPVCNSSGSTEIENKIEQLLIQNGIEYIKNDRKQIYPLELDFYLPKQSIGIEANGLYWHSEKQGKDKNRHAEKYKRCQEKGITLYAFWEDEIHEKFDIVSQMILNKAGVSQQRKESARNLRIVEVDSLTASEFFNKNHIQGFKRSTVYLGLETRSGELVSLCSFLQMGDNNWVLERFASSCLVRGGFSKILSHFKKEGITITTFSDNRYSDGSLYRNTGFVEDKEIRPDYSYVYKGRRVHKSNFRKKRFEKDSELTFVEGATETQLASMNGILRMWDYGKVRWKLTVT